MTTDAILYGALGGTATTSDLYSIDPRTGSGTSIGAAGVALTGLAWDPTGPTMYGATSGNSTAHPKSLVSVNLTTGAATFIGSFGGGVGVADISCDSGGNLYGWGAGDKKLYSINKSTGVATAVGPAQPIGSSGNGLCFDGADVLYVFPEGTNGDVYTVNVGTGVVTIFALLNDPILAASVAAATIGQDGIVYASRNDFGSPVALVEINLARELTGTIGATFASPPLDALSWNQPPALIPLFNGPTWVHFYPATTSPPAGGPTGLALHEGLNKVYLFGVQNAGPGDYNLWSWDGSDWTQEAPAHTPPPTPSSWPICYDPVHNYVLTLAARQTAGVWASETWKYDGSDWTQITVATPPQPLTGYGMAFDRARGKMVLYGGSNLNTGVPQNDTYTWDGTDWTLALVGVPGTTAPSASDSPGMAYDKIRQKVIAYGGTPSLGNTDETWAWDGSAWTNLGVTIGASRSQNIGLGWSDNAKGIVALVNTVRETTGNTQNQNPTYVWDGTSWTGALPLTTRLSPPARNLIDPPHGMSSGLAGSAFVFGIYEYTNLGAFQEYLNDTWEFFAWPLVTTGGVSGDTGTTAVLEGTVEGLDSVDWAFEWGTDRSYGHTSAGGTAPAGTTAVSDTISGLTVGNTYHYRIVGSIAGSPVFFGDDATFTEEPLPNTTVNCEFSV